MTTIHVTNDYNVEASVNAAFAAALTAFTLPAWLTLSSTPVVYDFAEIAASTPCFSFIHFPGSSSDKFQGRNDSSGNATMENTGLFEIDAWVSRDQKYNGQDIWAARLKYMKGMVQSATATLSIVQIYDYTTPSAPTKAGYKVNMSDLMELQVAADPNPSIQRKRFQIRYRWHQRA